MMTATGNEEQIICCFVVIMTLLLLLLFKLFLLQYLQRSGFAEYLKIHHLQVNTNDKTVVQLPHLSRICIYAWHTIRLANDNAPSKLRD